MHSRHKYSSQSLQMKVASVFFCLQSHGSHFFKFITTASRMSVMVWFLVCLCVVWLIVHESQYLSLHSLQYFVAMTSSFLYWHGSQFRSRFSAMKVIQARLLIGIITNALQFQDIAYSKFVRYFKLNICLAFNIT